MNRIFSFIVFLILVIGGGFAIGFLTVPGEWYAALQHDAFSIAAWLSRADRDGSQTAKQTGRAAFSEMAPISRRTRPSV